MTSVPPNPYAAQPPNAAPPANGLVWAILSTIFCCLPFGVVAIVKASQVNSQWAAGQFEQAAKSAADARKWTIAGVVTGLVVTVIYLIYYFAVLSAATSY